MINCTLGGRGAEGTCNRSFLSRTTLAKKSLRPIQFNQHWLSASFSATAPGCLSITQSEPIVDARRYLIETASYFEVTELLTVARSSFRQLSASDQQAGTVLLCEILNVTGIVSGPTGHFTRGLLHLRHAERLLGQDMGQNQAIRSRIEINMGNALATTGQLEEGLQYQLRALRTKEQAGIGDGIDLVQQNIARNLFYLGRFEEAREQINIALAEFKNSQNWAMLAL